MLVKAMEVSGIEGTFRTTCENVMQVLRTNKDSVMAMMEVSYSHSCMAMLANIVYLKIDGRNKIFTFLDPACPKSTFCPKP